MATITEGGVPANTQFQRYALWDDAGKAALGNRLVLNSGAGLITQRSQVQILPPPPSTGVLGAFLRMHRPLTSMFGRRLLRLLGQFVGTYSALAYAA